MALTTILIPFLVVSTLPLRLSPCNFPHSPPGHVLCLNCCNNIVKKTPARLSPACPFCRVNFTADSARLIRIDFGSAWSSPKRTTIEAHEIDVGEDDVLLLKPGSLKTRAEARRLESKVAQVAAKKCSVEEVTTLHKELQDWLSSDKLDEQVRDLIRDPLLLLTLCMLCSPHRSSSVRLFSARFSSTTWPIPRPLVRRRSSSLSSWSSLTRPTTKGRGWRMSCAAW